MTNIIVKSGMNRSEVDALNKECLSDLGLCLLRVKPLKRCDDCNTNKFACYMLEDSIWMQELGLQHNNNLCFNCMLKRLSRKLHPFDFKQAPVNECIIATIINNNAY